MKFNIDLKIKLLASIIVSFFILVFTPSDTFAQCGVGQSCFPTVEIDTFYCLDDFVGNCYTPFVTRVSAPCSNQVSCVTDDSWCSANDLGNCNCQGFDAYGNCIGGCGWGSTGCGDINCSACSAGGCCAGGGPTPTSPPVPTLPPPPLCSVSGPTSPSVTSLTPASATLNWTPGSGGTSQLIRVGPDPTEVLSGCPGGVGPSPLCVVATSLALGVSSYDVSGLDSDTTYYWRVVEFDSGGDWMDFGGICNTAFAETFTTPLVECIGYTAHPVSLNGTGDTAVTLPVTLGSITPPYGVDPLIGILFTVNPPAGIAGITATLPNPDTTAAYQVEMEALGIGSTTYSATATLNDPGATQCFDEANINVSNPVGWWQVKEGDAMTNGSIFSDIPPACSLPACDPVFITEDVGEYPGVASHDGSYGSGTVSSTNWLAANSEYSSTEPYSYAFFESRIPSSVTPVNPGLILNLADVTTGALGPAGYYWFQASTDLQITNPGGASVGSNKVIVFVDGNLTINGRIPVNDGTGSFLVVVSGDISVDPSVGGPQEVPTPLPDLEGLYITDGNFNTGTTGTGDVQLHVRGSVAALGSFNFQRQLADNSLTPGELFEYGADQAILFHQDLTGVRTIWREVAP